MMSDDGMSRADRRTRVAVLGGGPAALTAAFELTATPCYHRSKRIAFRAVGA